MHFGKSLSFSQTTEQPLKGQLTHKSKNKFFPSYLLCHLRPMPVFFFLQAEKSKIWRIQSPSKKSIGDVTSAFLRSFQLGASTQNRWSAQKKDCSEMLALQWEQLKKKEMLCGHRALFV